MHEKKRRHISIRSNRGLHLVELLAAIFISGLLAIVLGSSLSEIIRLSTKSDRSILAATAAQEVIDRVRSTPFSELPEPGTYQVQVNLGGADDTVVSASGGLISQRPVMLDGTRLTWLAQPNSGELPKNRFQGSINLTISDLPVTEARKVSVEVQWNDSSSKQTRKLETSTIVAANGIMRHATP